jgi:hypothetical protein
MEVRPASTSVLLTASGHEFAHTSAGNVAVTQFCLYVYDSYVHLKRCESANRLTTKEVNTHTAEWIRGNVAFRWVELGTSDLIAAELYLRRTWRPTLNTLQAQS